MVFHGVRYHLPSTLPEERESQLTRLLTTYHATRADSIFDATYIITNSEAFEGWQDVDPQKVAIVSVGVLPAIKQHSLMHFQDIWVERSIAANKMQQ
jgi:hypothetical protein